MSSPQVIGVAPGSPAERAGLRAGDEILTIGGEVPRDVIRWQLLTDESTVELTLNREGQRQNLVVEKNDGEPLGVEVHAAVFDKVQTCDNHCEFCFIHQLPRGMRRSLYLKDDDYRLSFLYGNFTTLTRFSELDLERVITERLSPLHVSIHATDPEIRADILHNRRGSISLRWLKVLLENNIEVHGQVVVCPGLNDADVLEDTLAGVLERFPDLSTVSVVPLGISSFSKQARMRAHTLAEAERVVDIIDQWQDIFLEAVGRRMVFAADEYYLLAGREFPAAETYGDFPMHEDGIGMARTMQLEFDNAVGHVTGPRAGFFAWVDGAPADGYRAPREDSPATLVGGSGTLTGSGSTTTVTLRPRRNAPVGVLTGTMGAEVITPLIQSLGREDVRVIPVPNVWFGGNIGVTGLMVGADIAAVLETQPKGHRYLLPDVCLSRGRFLDDVSVDDLPRPVEVIATDGHALRAALTSENS